MLRQVRSDVLPAMEKQGPVVAWIVGDTGLPKKGSHSVGVSRQYCGQVGKQENCQVAVSLSVATWTSSLPIAWRLYLPEGWARKGKPRRQAGVPEEVVFQTKPQIALEQIGRAVEEGVPQGVLVADAGYGIDSQFRAGVIERGLEYVVGVESSTTVWEPGKQPLPARPWKGRGRPPRLRRRDPAHQPVSVQQLAIALPSSAWKRVGWRQGSKRTLRSRFVRPCACVLPIAITGRRNPMRRSGHSSNGHGRNWSRPSTGFQPYPPRFPFPTWSSWPSSAGSLRGTIRNLSRNRDWDIMKGEVGAVFIIMRRCASLLMGPWLPSGTVFPPLPGPVILDYRSRRYRPTSSPGARRLRPVLHNPHSIATLRQRLARYLLRQLLCCPFCGILRL
jgi:hypothetical protein